MSCPFKTPGGISRRLFFKAAGGLGLVAAGAGLGAELAPRLTGTAAADTKAAIPFWGRHQAGIVTPQQAHTYFAAFDLTATNRADVVRLLQVWTQAADALTRGLPANGKDKPDSGDADGLSPARLTLTFGFGASLFSKDGDDRYHLAAQRPEALVDMPKFNGDQLIAEQSGGDLSVQACAEDPQVAFHAIRQLARLAEGIAHIRWTQSGFSSGNGKDTPRNLMGFKDGTQRPFEKEIDGYVWTQGPNWMKGGSYLVARRIRMALEHWDNTETSFQEEVIGRTKQEGAPLGMKNETDPLDLEAVDKDGNFIIPENAHVRLAAAQTHGGAQILRRGYSYNNGVNFTAERWPPWRQGLEYDAGLFFIAYQNDPRTGFIKIFDKMSKFDAMNQYVTHVSNGLFAIPAGALKGEYIGQGLFESV